MTSAAPPVMLPAVPLPRALARANAIWTPGQTAHHVVYGASGAGKTTLIKAIMDLRPDARTLVIDPKPHADPSWNGPPDDPWRYGRPVTTISPQFGFTAEPGGGPRRLRYRLTGAPDRADTARRFADALRIVAAEGHVVLVLDDVRETCKQLRLAGDVDSILNLGRSASVLAILSATETGYVAGRSQAGIIWCGATNGLPAAKAAAGLLGQSGRAWWEACTRIQPHAWIYNDSAVGTAGPALITPAP